MDTLLAIIAEIGDDDDNVILFSSAKWSDESLELLLKVSTFGSSPKDYLIRCSRVLAYDLKDEYASTLKLTEDHPLLWPFRYDEASAFFTGVPHDCNAAIVALYNAHREAVNGWFGLEAHMNMGTNLIKLLTGGHGLLAQGPIPLLEIYKKVLSAHGVEVEITSPFSPPGRMSNFNTQYEFKNETKALLIGSSYIIGTGWSTQEGA